MLFSVLAFSAVVLTYAMFQSRNAMLGFPSAIMWAILGGYAYGESTTTWDIYFIFAFGCLLGMVTFCTLGAYGLREKRDTIADEEVEKGEAGFVDEGNGHKDETTALKSENEPEPSSRRSELRSRAKRRRRVSRPSPKGEFDF